MIWSPPLKAADTSIIILIFDRIGLEEEISVSLLPS